MKQLRRIQRRTIEVDEPLERQAQRVGVTRTARVGQRAWRWWRRHRSLHRVVTVERVLGSVVVLLNAGCEIVSIGPLADDEEVSSSVRLKFSHGVSLGEGVYL